MRPIYFDKKHLPLMQGLTRKQGGSKVAIFQSYRELLCYAALLGYQDGVPPDSLPADSSGKDRIQWYDFAADDLHDYIFITALADTQDISILDDTSDEGKASQERNKGMEQIFEEYAHRGLNILATWVKKGYGDTLAHAIIKGLKEDGYLSETSKQEEPATDTDDKPTESTDDKPAES
ncbi:MAG: hypothetical protein GDA54_03715 [Alphaproteobacteria bacterium GM7ARS4]|nr:hypothetical protein [Alphaproteobacteria bacterium GM7ARS4]